jgi:hypothetical protein
MSVAGLEQARYPLCVIQKNYFRNKGDEHVIKYKESDCCTEVRIYRREFDGSNGGHVAVIMPMCSGKSFYSRRYDNVIDIDT